MQEGALLLRVFNDCDDDRRFRESKNLHPHFKHPRLMTRECDLFNDRWQ